MSSKALTNEMVINCIGRDKFQSCMIAAVEFMKNNTEGDFQNLPKEIKVALVRLIVFHKFSAEQVGEFLANAIENLGWLANRTYIKKELSNLA